MRKLYTLLSLLLIFTLIGSTQQAEAQTASQTVRVAFLPEMYGFYIIEDNGDYSGYNYDYLMNVAQHTNWEYEFVVIEEGSVSASLMKAEEMMLSGDLDLVGPYSATSPNIANFETGEQNYGVYRYCYYSARNDNTISQDNYFLQENLKVGLVEYYTELNDLFFQMAEHMNIIVEPVYVQSHGEMIELILNEEVDTIINLDMSSHSEYLNYLTTVQRIPFYFASTKGNTQLIADLDEAIRRIETVEPAIHQRLLDTYFGTSYQGNFIVSEYEKEFLAEIDSIKIGLLRDIPPYQYINDKGEADGITIDILTKLEKIVGIPYEVFWYDSLPEISHAIDSQEIDIVGSLSNNYKLAHSLDVTLTSPYISGGVYWIKNENSGENLLPMYHYVSGTIPFFQSEELTMVWDMKEALDSVSNNKDVSVICDPYIADYYLSLYSYDNLTVQSVSNVLNEMTLGVGNHMDVSVIGVLNRAILFLDSYSVDEIVYNHTSVKPEVSYMDLFSEYAFEINMVLIIISAFIIYSVYGTSKKFRELSRRDGLTKLYNTGYFREYVENKLSKISSGVLILVDIDFFKDVNDNYGHSTGDKIIQQVAQHMVGLRQSKGFYARVGGDEFALLIEGKINKEELEKEATEFLKSMAENETGIPATLSIGGFIFEDSVEYEMLYKNADKVLYKVKETGRNGFLLTDSVDNTSLDKASNLLNYAMFQQKVTQLISTEIPSKNHALMLIHLKNIHIVSDDYISGFFDEVAGRIKKQVRQHDFLCAKEDSSFLLFLSSCGTSQNLSDCRLRIEKSLNEPFVSNSEEFSIQTKVTVKMYPEDGSTYPELIEKLNGNTGDL
ncbi:MAG: diguanylate cyclase [Eubacteriales bacterium]